MSMLTSLSITQLSYLPFQLIILMAY